MPGVAAVERQLDLRARDRLLDDEIEELPYLIDQVSLELFGIPVRARYDRAAWEANFDLLSRYDRDPNAHWRAFDLDIRCDEGRALHCIEVFGRQLVCALNGLLPQAIIAFADAKTARAA